MKTSKLSTRQICHVKFAACLATISVLMLAAGNALTAPALAALGCVLLAAGLGVLLLSPGRVMAMVCAAGFFVMFSDSAYAQGSLYYNHNLPDGSYWSGAGNWSATGPEGPFEVDWANQSTAHFTQGEEREVVLRGEQLEFGPAGGISSSLEILVIRDDGVEDSSMTFDGSSIQAGTGAQTSIRLRGELRLAGNFTLQGGSLALGSNLPFVGRVVVLEGGFLRPDSLTAIDSSTDIEIQGGFFQVVRSGDYTMGTLVLDESAVVEIGPPLDFEPVRLSITGIEGGRAIIRPRNNLNHSLITSSLILDLSEDSEFTGNFQGTNKSEQYGTTSLLTLTKTGAADVTFSGGISQMQAVVVEQGGLFFAGKSTKSIGNSTGVSGPAARVASGGQFGGVETRVEVLDGASIVVEPGGQIVAGLPDETGTFELEFVEGGSLDLESAAGAGSMRFLIGGGANHGTILLRGGNLQVGTQPLGFADFDFVELPGFGPGTYILIELADGATINGEVATGPAAAGRIGTRRASIKQQGDAILLEVER